MLRQIQVTCFEARPRRAASTLLALICGSILFFYWCSIGLDAARKRPSGRPVPVSPPQDVLGVEPGRLILNQDSCSIPKTDITPTFFRKGKGKWHTSWVPSCEYEETMTRLEGEEILHLLPEYENLGCCISEITRRNKSSDYDYKLSHCEPFRSSRPANLRGKQMVVVKCGDRLNFKATIPTNGEGVEAKLKYWQNQAPVSPSVSVLLIGVDSVSRSHAYRSLPMTLNYMTSEMGFLDFKGFHSIAPSTLPNFMGFLMGLTEPEVRSPSGCAPTWQQPFDDCPLIWKEYDTHHYVTMYIEDGNQTFNWASEEAGFRFEPTDFYIHPLFKALVPMRREHSRPYAVPWWKLWEDWKDDLHAPCMSNETVPQFMLRYTQRFVEKFRTSPFFAFIFFAYPFHEDTYSLPTIDDEFLVLMQALNAHRNRAMLDNTLIVFLSDHGDRGSFFNSASVEAYLERALPPLFVRMPAGLAKKFPEFEMALRVNAKRLVSPFDLHHTFRHLLHLGEGKRRFNPVLEDRSSLLVEVSGGRTCEQLHLGDSCLCNTDIHFQPVTDPSLLKTMSSFVQTALNRLVRDAGFQNICAEWSTDVDSVLSAYTLKKNSDTHESDILFKFRARPVDARFEAKLRVHEANRDSEGDGDVGGSGRIELLGSFARISIYGNQSFCIPSVTAQDKKMKELCVCSSILK